MTPWSAVFTPVTMAVWFGHVTVGFTGFMPSATAPSRISFRKTGNGSLGSRNTEAGNPSRLITTTWRLRSPTGWAKADAKQASASHTWRRRQGAVWASPRVVFARLIFSDYLGSTPAAEPTGPTTFPRTSIYAVFPPIVTCASEL